MSISKTSTSISAVALLLVGTLMAAPPVKAQDPLRAVTTLPVFAELVKEIGGDKVNVEAIASPIQDPHFVEAKPSFILDAGKADLWVEAGMSLEIGWAPLVLQGSRNGRIQPGAAGYVDASSHVQKLNVPGRVDRSRGDVHPEGNPHYWLDPLNAVPLTADITLALTRLDPANATYYADRRRAFLAELDRRMIGWRERMAPLRGLAVVSYHESWQYLARRFGLNLVGQLEPKPGIPPSPSHLANLIEQMRQADARVILVEPYYETKNPELVARETGATVVVLPNQPGAGSDSYFGLIDQIVDRLTAAARSTGGNAR